MIDYQAHVQNVGWTDTKTDGETAGTVGEGLRLEGLKVDSDYNLECKAHVQNVGWQDWVNVANWPEQLAKVYDGSVQN